MPFSFLRAGHGRHYRLLFGVMVGVLCFGERVPRHLFLVVCAMSLAVLWGAAWRAPRRIRWVAGLFLCGAWARIWWPLPYRLPVPGAAEARIFLVSETRRLLPGEAGALLLSVTIGEKGQLPKSTVTAFRTTGASHVLAVSGYNVTITALVAHTILLWAGLRRRWAAGVTIISLVFFLGVTGGAPPVLRAVVMGTLLLLGKEAGRRADTMSIVGTALTILLFLDPGMDEDVGFLLSFTALAGLIWLTPVVEQAWGGLPYIRVLPDSIRRPMTESWAALLATAPISIGLFGGLSLGAPLVAIPLAFLVPIVTIVGACFLGLVFFWPGLAFVVAPGVRLLFEAFAAVPVWGARLPGVFYGAGYFLPGLGVAWYVLLGLCLQAKQTSGLSTSDVSGNLQHNSASLITPYGTDR